MNDLKQIKSALISVFYKDGLEPVIKKLNELNISIYSTGGTQQYIESLSVPSIPIEKVTGYPSILGGRVKTLHPKVFGGILGRREQQDDIEQMKKYQIPEIDLVIVDLYPFEATVASGAEEQESIEKIDIGGISLIRAAAKNYKDVVIISSRTQYANFLKLLNAKQGYSSLEERKQFAQFAFHTSSHYDTAIFNYFDKENSIAFKQSFSPSKVLRYGENPHQKGTFYGDLGAMFTQLHGKELSYNNLLDIDAAVNLMTEFSIKYPSFAILKHNNACGVATKEKLIDAWKDTLAGDPVSAFGGIVITNHKMDKITAEEINKLFCEVVIAPDYEDLALSILKQKKNRIILKQKKIEQNVIQFRTALNGVLMQDKDVISIKRENFKVVTKKIPSAQEEKDLEFANKIVKHTKSNTIVLAKNEQLLAIGTGQTSRVDALKQAIMKANTFSFDLKGAVMSSDAFFPFPDCVEIAHNVGISAVIQPGGSIKDEASIEFCNDNNMAMIFTGIRHFKH